MTIKFTVTSGPSADITWISGMNAQNALERAEDSLGNDLIFSIEYYGSGLGYLVNMINETYDTFKSSSSPFYFWEFLVNGETSEKGIDKTVLNDGDEIRFTYTTYSQTDVSTLTTAKHSRR